MSHDADTGSSLPLPAELRDVRSLSSDQARAVQEFIKQVGGVDNARQALAALVKLKEAA